MAVYSVNQVRQLYAATNVSDITVKKCQDGKCLYFTVPDALGRTQHTDHIDLDKISWVHLTKADAMEPNTKKVTITLNADAFDGDKTISGQDYILRINLRQYYGMSDEDIYQKYGAVHGTKIMTKTEFVQAMVESLTKNFSREEVPSLQFEADGDTIVITELPQYGEWALGTKQLRRVYFDVIPTTVVEPEYYNEVVWGKATVGVSDETIANSYQLADMEYFYHGYRGDQYRNIMWPKSIPTKYMLTAGEDIHYDVVDLQYYYAGDNEDIQHSAKTMTFVVPKNSGITLINNLKTTGGVPESKIKIVEKSEPNP